MARTDLATAARVRKADLPVERAQRPKSYSKQQVQTDTLVTSLMNWQSEHLSERQKYPYRPDSRKRDAWLSELWKKEPHLSGVLNSVVAIDKNRNWTLTGTKRQVVLYNNIFRYADDNAGWREFISVSSENFYTSDLGSVIEIGRDGRVGPMRGLYNVDPTKVRLTGDRSYPYEYFPDGGASVRWAWLDAFRLTSMPSSRDKYHRLGFCAISRAVELVSLLLAVYEYDQEMLLAKAPKGLLLLHNIGEQQWEDALAARREKMSAMGQDYFSGVIVLAQEGMDQIDAKLIGLSQLPSGFDREVVTNQIMYGFSLIFGYPPDEFWPIQYGALGRGRETEIHYLRSLSKGGNDYALGLQDRIQQELPDTVLFEFDNRNPESALAEATLHLEWGKAADMLYNGTRGDGMGVMSRDEVRSILTSKNIIDPTVSEMLDDAVATATEGMKRDTRPLRLRQDEYRTNLAVMRSAELFSTEPVIRMHYPSGLVDLLFDRGEDLFAKTLWPGVAMVVLPKQTRQLEEVNGANGATDLTDGQAAS